MNRIEEMRKDEIEEKLFFMIKNTLDYCQLEEVVAEELETGFEIGMLGYDENKNDYYFRTASFITYFEDFDYYIWEAINAGQIVISY